MASNRKPLPLCHRRLQSCHRRAVLVPERFRGGCPFGATCSVDSPAWRLQQAQDYRPSHGRPELAHGSGTSALRQLVVGVRNRFSLGPLGGQLSQRPFNAPPDAP